jgi:hypothetical protein
MMSRQAQRWFGVGNLAIACIFVAADFAIPLKSMWLDAPVAAVALLLWVSAFGVLLRQTWARAVLRVSATVLLAFGLLAVALLAITSAFLFGVHGHFLRDGVELVVVGFGLLLPYAIAYPMLTLAALNSAHSGQRL